MPLEAKIGSIVLLIVVAYVPVMYMIMTISSWREKRRPPKAWDEDRRPNRDEFMDDPHFGGKSALQKYYQAQHEWAERMAKRVVYELPLEDILTRDDLEGWYCRETLKRNPKYCRDPGDLGDYHSCCQVCGSPAASMYNELHVMLCHGCYMSMTADSRADSSYKPPTGATGFSAELWILHMIVALDLESGVINEAQARRELRIIVELERRRIEKEKQRQQHEAEKKLAAEQRSNELMNAASRLH